MKVSIPLLIICILLNYIVFVILLNVSVNYFAVGYSVTLSLTLPYRTILTFLGMLLTKEIS